jgi:DNA ligase (NAD+)
MIKSAFKLFSSGASRQGRNGNIFHSTQTCPECGSKLWAEANSENWLCPNPDCPAQVRRGLGHWCAPAAMDVVAGGDEKLIALLVQHGLARDVAELYRIKVAELAALPGMDQESAQTFFDALTASLKCEGWRLLFGLNIPLVGAAEAQALGRGFPTVDAVFAAGVPRLMQDAGVSEAVALSVVRWHSDAVNRKLVRRLQKAGLNFKSELPAV